MTARGARRALLILCAALPVPVPVSAASPDAERIRNEEIAECRSGDLVTWGDGRDQPAPLPPPRFTYDPAGAPLEMDEPQVLDLLRRALQAWSGCGIGGELLPWGPGRAREANVVVVRWSESESRGNFGLADLGRRRLALSPATFRLLRQRNPGHDYRQTMQMAIAHEMGHFYGLMAHSRRCIDVTSYYHDGRGAQGEQCLTRNPAGRQAFVEYRHVLPTACDLRRCRIANGIPLP